MPTEAGATEVAVEALSEYTRIEADNPASTWKVTGIGHEKLEHECACTKKVEKAGDIEEEKAAAQHQNV